MNPATNQFSFKHFDSLPQNEILPEAQKFLAARFPPGSDTEKAVNELTKAGAKCGKTREWNGDPLYLCSYSHGFLVQVEWKIAIYVERDDEKRIRNVVVNRGLTGL